MIRKVFQEKAMRGEKVKEIIRVLMDSRFYFNLDVRERYKLIIHVLEVMDEEPVLQIMEP